MFFFGSLETCEMCCKGQECTLRKVVSVDPSSLFHLCYFLSASSPRSYLTLPLSLALCQILSVHLSHPLGPSLANLPSQELVRSCRGNIAAVLADVSHNESNTSESCCSLSWATVVLISGFFITAWDHFNVNQV